MMNNIDSKLIQEAISQKNAGNFGQSEKLYSKAIELNGPNLHKAYYNKGNLFKELDKIEDALHCYQKATSIKPDYGMAWANLGDLLCKIHAYSEALQAFNNAQIVMPHEPNPKFGLAFALNKLSDFQASLNILKKLLDESETSDLDKTLLSKIHSETGVALMHTNHVPIANLHFEKAYELNQCDYQACYNIAFIADMQKKYDVAILFYDRAIVLTPNEAKGYQGKGCTLIHMGNFEEALGYIQKAIELNPNNFEGYYNLACAHSHLNNEKELLDAISKTLSLAPKQINIKHHILNDPDFSNYHDKISLMI